jgi:hypothetical protein
VLRRDTSFYMLGWTPTTYDAHNALNGLMACVDDKGAGQFNLGAYCNPKVDELTKKIQSETDKTKRNAMIKEAFEPAFGRHWPPAAAPAGAGLGREQEGRAGPDWPTTSCRSSGSASRSDGAPVAGAPFFCC